MRRAADRCRRTKLRACLECGGTSTVAMLYGMPTAGTAEAIERGGEIPGVAIGGRVIFPDNPTWACPDCEHRW